MKINNLVKKEILDLYNQGMSGVELGKKFNRHCSTIYKYIKQQGGVIRNSADASQIYCINKTYFSKLDTEEKAYWLGFIYADGCITGGKLQIGLSDKDKSHLLKFKNAIEYGGPLHYYKSNTNPNKTNVILSISNRYIIKDLNSLGVFPRKTFTCKFPSIPRKLLSHFMRGYFDGDGTISFEKDVFKGTSVIGNKQFMTAWQSIISKKLNLTPVKLIESRNAFVYSKRGVEQPLKILNFYYENANVFLERKHNQYSPLVK